MHFFAKRLLRRTILPRQPGHHSFHAPVTLGCRHLYNDFEENRTDHASIVRSQIPPTLLPYTVALMEASRLPRPLVGRSAIALLNKLYSRPDGVAARVQELPAGQAQQINHTYDIVNAMVADFATCALERVASNSGDISSSVSLSPAEHFRFCRAFYRVELFYTLFGCGRFNDDMNRWFFSRHSPWENEQLACVYGYLATKLDQGSPAYATDY